jgi:hypothetical protein
MPRCTDYWRRYGDVTVGVTATGTASQFYSLVYVLYRKDQDLPLTAGGSFNSTQLREGVSWAVPEGHRCEFELVTTSNAAINTQITLNDAPAVCTPGSHCQGACAPSGAAGLAGAWTVTAATRP